MAIRYKLTDENMRTYGGFQWELNVPISTDGSGELCSKGWLHCYSNPILAILLNPIHANIKNPRLFKCIASGNHKYDKGLKEGCTTLELTKEIELPNITINQKVAFGILCSMTVFKTESYNTWANNWLSGKDRSSNAAAAANAACYAAAAAAANAAYYAAANAAYYAAYYAAAAAAYAADYAAYVINLNFNTILKQCLQY